MSEQDPGYLDTKFMVDPYMNWLLGEGVPIHTGQAIDTLTVPLQPWSRFGMNGAACNVDGGCDFLTAFVFELASGKSSAQIRHLYEQVHYVLAGEGRTEIILSDGRKETIHWHEKNLFAFPVNARVRHFSTGTSPMRMIAFSNLRYLLGLYRNEKFLFANDAPMHGRQQRALVAGFIANPLLLPTSKNELTPISLADLSIGVDITSLDQQSSMPARRQMQGRQMMGLDGQGATISFTSEKDHGQKTIWGHGILVGLKRMTFHRHLNEGDKPARMFGVELGSIASPMFRSRRHVYGDTNVYASGAALID